MSIRQVILHGSENSFSGYRFTVLFLDNILGFRIYPAVFYSRLYNHTPTGLKHNRRFFRQRKLKAKGICYRLVHSIGGVLTYYCGGMLRRSISYFNNTMSLYVRGIGQLQRNLIGSRLKNIGIYPLINRSRIKSTCIPVLRNGYIQVKRARYKNITVALCCSFLPFKR